MGPGLGGLLSEYFQLALDLFLSISRSLSPAILLGRYYLPQENRSLCKEIPNLTNQITFVVFLAGILCGILLIPGTRQLRTCPYPLLTTGIVAGLIFLRLEQKNPDPLINPSLLKNRNFTLGYHRLFIVTALFSGVTYFLPLYLVNFPSPPLVSCRHDHDDPCPDLNGSKHRCRGVLPISTGARSYQQSR